MENGTVLQAKIKQRDIHGGRVAIVDIVALQPGLWLSWSRFSSWVELVPLRILTSVLDTRLSIPPAILWAVVSMFFLPKELLRNKAFASLIAVTSLWFCLNYVVGKGWMTVGMGPLQQQVWTALWHIRRVSWMWVYQASQTGWPCASRCGWNGIATRTILIALTASWIVPSPGSLSRLQPSLSTFSSSAWRSGMFQAYFLLEHEVVVRFGIKICVFTIVWDKEGSSCD